MSQIFRKIEQSHETNLLDSLSKSLEQGIGDSKQKLVGQENLLASSTLNLLDGDDLLNEGDDEDILNMQQKEGNDSAILNMLDDEINDDDENVPSLDISQLATNKPTGDHAESNAYMTPNMRSSIEEENSHYQSATAQLQGIERLKNVYGDAVQGSLSVISEEKSQWMVESFSAASSKHY